VEKLRELAAACERAKRWPPDEPFLLEAYVFGDVLSGADPLDAVEVALVLNLPPEEVPWESSPHGTQWLADELRLSKGGFAYWWRSHLEPVPNHHIRGPVRFWSREGPTRTCCRPWRSGGSVTCHESACRPGSGSSGWPPTWKRRSPICAPSATGTGIMTGVANTADPAATPSTSCGKRPTDTWTCATHRSKQGPTGHDLPAQARVGWTDHQDNLVPGLAAEVGALLIVSNARSCTRCRA
jgi:hypothetical protein